MTTREELLEAVAKAAWGRARLGGLGLDPYSERLYAALDALDAHRDPEPDTSEMVDVRAYVRVSKFDPNIYLIEGGGRFVNSFEWPVPEGTFATITARVPLPSVPTIAAHVEAFVQTGGRGA